MPFTESDLKRQTILLEEIENQSDRGAAIVGAAWLDEELIAAIKTKFIEDEKPTKNLFNGTGPLSSFSSKIELAYLLGIVNKNHYSDLHKIRKIRNEFAHEITSKEIETLNFSSAAIEHRCLNIGA